MRFRASIQFRQNCERFVRASELPRQTCSSPVILSDSEESAFVTFEDSGDSSSPVAPQNGRPREFFNELL